MTYRSRDERLALQEHDDGDPDDTVFVAYNPGQPLSKRGYHDDPDCEPLRRATEVREYTREGAQHRWLPPCKICTVPELCNRASHKHIK